MVQNSWVNLHIYDFKVCKSLVHSALAQNEISKWRYRLERLSTVANEKSALVNVTKRKHFHSTQNYYDVDHKVKVTYVSAFIETSDLMQAHPGAL